MVHESQSIETIKNILTTCTDHVALISDIYSRGSINYIDHHWALKSKSIVLLLNFNLPQVKKFLWRQIRAMLLIYKVKSCRSASSTSWLPSFCLWTHLYLLLSSLSCSLSAFFWPALYCCCCFFFSILTDMLNKAIIMRPPTAGKLSNNSNINPTNSIQLPGPAWY